MKIFANNFAMSLHHEDPDASYRIERMSLQAATRLFTLEEALFPGQVACVNATTDPNFLLEILALLRDPAVADKTHELQLFFERKKDRKKFFKRFKKHFEAVPAAGGLVLNAANELLLIYRNGFWDLPKGKIEKGESPEWAGMREVKEETGLRGHGLQSHFEDTYHIFYRNRWKFKQTWWYRMTVIGRPDLKPQIKEGITDVRWVPLDELRREIPDTYPQIVGLIRKLLQKA